MKTMIIIGFGVSGHGTMVVLSDWRQRSWNHGCSLLLASVAIEAWLFVVFGAGGNVTIVGGSSNLSISTTFTGLSTSINNRTYYLGQTFTKGVSNPEIDNKAVIIKKVPQSPFNQSTKAPEEDARLVLPAVPIDAKSAYWVAV